MLEFHGQEKFKADPERLFATLTDLNALEQCIPDLVSAEKSGSTRLVCKVKPGFSFLRGTLTADISIQDVQPPTSAKIAVQSKAIGMSMEMESTLAVSPDGSGSQLDWQAKITKMSGLISAVSHGLIKAAADKVVRQAWQKMRTRLDE